MGFFSNLFRSKKTYEQAERSKDEIDLDRDRIITSETATIKLNTDGSIKRAAESDVGDVDLFSELENFEKQQAADDASVKRWNEARQLKSDGKLSEAAELLIESLTKYPTCLHGQYRDLSKILRQLNRDDLKAKHYKAVVDRVTSMIHLDEVMIQEMLRHWSIIQKQQLPPDYFDKYRKLLVSDAKALKKAAEFLGDTDNVILAEKVIESFAKKKKAKQSK